jgi:CarD family transcriptional regulator
VSASTVAPAARPAADAAPSPKAPTAETPAAEPEAATAAAAKPGKKRPAKAAAKSEPARKKKTAATKPGKAAAKETSATATAKSEAAADAKPAAKSRSRSTAKPAADGADKAPAVKRKSTRKRRLQYKVGQQLVYPLQGVGQVRNIEERPFRDQTLLYYVVYLEVSDMTIMVPVDKADELGIRAIVPRTEARNALTLIGEDYEPIPTDWKLRYQMNLDLLKAGAVSDIATVVRALYHRSRIKELPILERKLYDNARSLLVDELSFSLGKEKAKVEELINSRLEVGVK